MTAAHRFLKQLLARLRITTATSGELVRVRFDVALRRRRFAGGAQAAVARAAGGRVEIPEVRDEHARAAQMRLRVAQHCGEASAVLRASARSARRLVRDPRGSAAPASISPKTQKNAAAMGTRAPMAANA